MGAGEPKFRIWLTISAGKKGKSRAGKALRQCQPELSDIIGGGRMIFVQRDQDVAILRPDTAGVEIGAVGARHRQADIVHDGNQAGRAE